MFIELSEEKINEEMTVFTIIDVKNIISRMDICIHVPVELLRKPVSLPPPANCTTTEKKILSPAVEPSVRQTRVSVDLNSQYLLFKIPFL